VIVNGRELILRQGFLQALLELERWVGQQSASKGRALVKRIMDFACDIVAPFPLAFPVYYLPAAPARKLRRAVLDRQYALIYEVHEEEIVFVYVYSTYRNPASIALSDLE